MGPDHMNSDVLIYRQTVREALTDALTKTVERLSAETRDAWEKQILGEERTRLLDFYDRDVPYHAAFAAWLMVQIYFNGLMPLDPKFKTLLAIRVASFGFGNHDPWLLCRAVDTFKPIERLAL